MARPKINPAGREYGKWTVQGIDPTHARRWLCLCDPSRGGCGAVKSLDATGLRSGDSTQCLSCSGRERHARGGSPLTNLGRDELLRRSALGAAKSRIPKNEAIRRILAMMRKYGVTLGDLGG